MAYPVNKEIDVGLSVLCILAEDGQTLTFKDMAEVCGCTPQLLSNTFERALKKMRNNPKVRELVKDL